MTLVTAFSRSSTAADDPRRFVLVLQALGVETQRGQRCAQAVREIGRVLAFGLEEIADARRERVERATHLDDLGRAAHPRARVEVAAAEPAGDVGQRVRIGP